MRSRTARAISTMAVAAVLTGCAGGSATVAPSSGATSPPATAPVRPTGPRSTYAATQPPLGPTSAPSTLPTEPPSGPPAEPSPAGSPEQSWARLEAGDGPGPRSDQTWTVDAGGAYAYLFGGTSERGALDDLWRLDLAANTWERLEPAGDRPSARFGHVAAWVPEFGLVIWSGQAGSEFFDDLWVFDPTAGTWRRLPDAGETPAARYGSCGAIGPDGRLWISHGFTSAGRFDDTRAYDFDASAWSDESPEGAHPVKRCLHDCLWAPNGQLVLYAGQTDGQPALGDLWTLDPTDGWSEAPRPPLDARQLYALTTLGDTAYVFGGRDRDGRYLDDTFALDLAGLGWTPITATEAPAPRSGATLIGAPSGDRLLLFGGTGRDGPTADLWELSVGG